MKKFKLLTIVILAICMMLASCAPVVDGVIQAYDVSYLFDVGTEYDTYAFDEESGEGVIYFDLPYSGMYDVYKNSGVAMSFGEYLSTPEALNLRAKLKSHIDVLKGQLSVLGIDTRWTFDVFNVGVSAKVNLNDVKQISSVTGTTPSLSQRAYVEDYQATEADILKATQNAYSKHNRGIIDNDTQYQGEGIAVAVLDTGLDLTHTAFSQAPALETAKYNYRTINSLWTQTEAYSISRLLANNVYRSQKIPFAFDYSDFDNNVTPTDTHGTHVAGIIGGNDSTITGGAPNCQLLIMKVFSDEETTTSEDSILAALSDCVILGVDIVNMSLGTACGLDKSYYKGTTRIISSYYQKAYESGVLICAAAANDYNSGYNSQLGLTSAAYPTNSVVGSGSTYTQSYSIASLDTSAEPYICVDDKNIMTYKQPDRTDTCLQMFLDGQTSARIDYIRVGSGGAETAYQNLDVAGKIVVVQRTDDVTIAQIHQIAKDHNAKGCIIISTSYKNKSFSLRNMEIPTIMVNYANSVDFAESGVIEFNKEYNIPIMSDFSSWGCGEDLSIKPEVTSYGGNVYSSVSGNKYEEMSGTSMATPNISAICAVVKQYLKSQKIYQDLSNYEIAKLVKNKISSNADIVRCINGNIALVRQQGAGVANLLNTINNGSYMISSFGEYSKLELGDDKQKSGIYNLDAQLFGNGQVVSYKISTIVAAAKITPDNTIMTEQTVNLGFNAVTTVDGQVTDTVATNEDFNVSRRIKVNITLTEEAKAYLDRYPNGIHIEGFLVLTDDDGNVVSVPFLAYYGDWSYVPAFDTLGLEGKEAAIANFELLGTNTIYGETDSHRYNLGSYVFDEGFDTTFASASLSTANFGMHKLVSVKLPLLRTVPSLKVYIEDDIGNLVQENEFDNVTKYFYNPVMGGHSEVDLVIDFDTAMTYIDNKGAKRNLVAGKYIYLKVSVALLYGEVTPTNSISIPIYLDGTRPEFDTDAFAVRTVDDSKFVDLKIKDDHKIMAIKLYAVDSATNSRGVQLGDALKVENFDKGQFNNLTFDVTNNLKDYTNNKLIVIAFDYAHNYTAYTFSF